MLQPHKILIIQTAFIGDAILATALVEKWKDFYPSCAIDVLVRKGNEIIFKENPYVRRILTWDKKNKKWRSWLQNLREIRRESYDIVINCQRYTSMSLLSLLSRAIVVTGFKSSIFSTWFDKIADHSFLGDHEVIRNQRLIADFTEGKPSKPKLYFSTSEINKIKSFTIKKYITISPASVWFTKTLPESKWISLLERLPKDLDIYLLGGINDFEKNESLVAQSKHPKITNMAGIFSLKESALLMASAQINVVQDSAPLHLCSAVNAPVVALFLSTVPAFGFGPLSDEAYVVETTQSLPCRPCGIHGKRACPKRHFDCAMSIDVEKIISIITKSIQSHAIRDLSE